jgi:hypoxanthine phosphoribosyltransferase
MVYESRRLLISSESIHEKVREMGQRLTADYHGEEILLVDLPCEIDFMEVSSYGTGTSSSGVVRILKDVEENVANRNVLIVEDIVDTGLTLNYLQRSLMTRKPNSL